MEWRFHRRPAIQIELLLWPDLTKRLNHSNRSMTLSIGISHSMISQVMIGKRDIGEDRLVIKDY
jgi:hypothetical protein